MQAIFNSGHDIVMMNVYTLKDFIRVCNHAVEGTDKENAFKNVDMKSLYEKVKEESKTTYGFNPTELV